MGLEQPLSCGFGYEVVLLVGELHREFPQGELGLFQCHLAIWSEMDTGIRFHILAQRRMPIPQCLRSIFA